VGVGPTAEDSVAKAPYSALATATLAPRAAPAVISPRRWWTTPAWAPWFLNPVALLLLLLIYAYRLLIPDGWKRQCIFTPTCSAYGLGAIKKNGPVAGSLRTWARIRRCNSLLSPGGEDPP